MYVAVLVLNFKTINMLIFIYLFIFYAQKANTIFNSRDKFKPRQ